MNEGSLFSWFYSMVLLLNKNVILILLIFFFYLFIQEVWRGLYKALTIIMFPGALIHIATHIIVAKIWKAPIVPILKISLFYERSLSVIKVKSLREIYATIILQLLFPPTLAYTIFYLADSTTQIVSKVILIWLGASIFIAGLPRLADFQLLLTVISLTEPIALIFFFWSIPLFIIGFIGFDLEIAFFGTAIYLMVLLLTLIIFEPPKINEDLDEEFVVDED